MRIHPTEQLAHWFIYRLLSGDVSGAPAPSWDNYYGITSYLERLVSDQSTPPGTMERHVRCFIADPQVGQDIMVLSMRVDSRRNAQDDWEMRVISVTYVDSMDCYSPASSSKHDRRVNDLSEAYVLFCRSRTRRQR